MLQTLGECSETVLALLGDEFSAQVDHVVLENPLDAPFQAVLQPDQRKFLHAVEQRQWNRATPDQTRLILDNERLDARCTHLQQTDRQGVLEIDLRRLWCRALAEAGATVIGQAFQVQAVIQLRQHFGLAGTGHPARQHETALLDSLINGIQQEMAHRLVAADDPRVLDAHLVLQPLLDDLRAQAATEAVQVTLRVGTGEIGPGLQTLGLGLAGHQLMAQLDSGFLPVLLVTGADLLPLDIIHQRQIDHAGKRALVEFHGRTGIHHRGAVEEQRAKIFGIAAHQRTSTAWLRAPTSWPIGSRARPSSAQTVRNSASPSGATATSKPPLVCGSQSSCLWRSSSVAMRSP